MKVIRILALAAVVALVTLPVVQPTSAQIEIPGFEYDEVRCYTQEPVTQPQHTDLSCLFENIRPASAAPVPTPAPTSTPVVGQATPVPTPHADTGQRVVPDRYSTITAALVGVQPGQSVLVRAGTYREIVTIRTAGVTIVGEPGAIVDGQCERVHGVYITADDVTIRGLSIRNTTEAAVLIGSERQTARTTVDGNEVRNYNCLQAGDQSSAGVAAWYAGPGHRVTNNVITRTARSKGNGIWFKSNSTDAASGGGHTITGNAISGGYDGIGGETEGNARGSFDRDTLIARNTVENCWDDGIQVEGGGQNIVVQDNVIRECGVGVAFATPLTGPLTVERNTIRSGSPGFYGQLACFKAGRASTATIVVRDNDCTVTGPTVAHGFQQTNSGAGVWQVTNNVFRVNGYVVETTTPAPAGAVFDGNCYQTSDTTGRLVKWAGVRYNTLLAFQAATGHERTGRLAPC